MAYVQHDSFPNRDDRDPIQVSGLAETQTTEGVGLPLHRRHRRLPFIALAATVAVLGGGSTAAFVLKGKNSGGDNDPASGKGGAAGGLAPAVSPSRHGLTPGVAGRRSTLPSPSVSKSTTGNAPAASASAHSSAASSSHHKTPKFDCTGLTVTRDGNTLHTTPKLTKQAHPDGANYVTVADYYHGINPATDPNNNHHTYTAVGYGSPVDIAVPPDVNWKDDTATVFVSYFPDGNMPSDPDKLSIHSHDAIPGRITAACGNAVLTWAMQTGQMGGLGKPG